MARRPKSILRDIERTKAAIAKQRDELRGLLDEANDVLQCCGDALDSLDYAVDALSRLL